MGGIGSHLRAGQYRTPAMCWTAAALASEVADSTRPTAVIHGRLLSGIPAFLWSHIPLGGSPLWYQAPEPVANWDGALAPVPEFVFDQRLG